MLHSWIKHWFISTFADTYMAYIMINLHVKIKSFHSLEYIDLIECYNKHLVSSKDLMKDDKGDNLLLLCKNHFHIHYFIDSSVLVE